MSKWQITSIVLAVVLVAVGVFAFTTQQKLDKSRVLVASTQSTLDDTQDELKKSKAANVAATQDNTALQADNDSLVNAVESYDSCVAQLGETGYTKFNSSIVMDFKDLKSAYACFINAQDGVGTDLVPV